MSVQLNGSRRNIRFDCLRILFATMVLLSHAPEITDGNKSRELFARLTGTDLTFGTVGVDGFFLLSGFLIVQSWNGDPDLFNFLRKRLLRIVPGYLVAALLSTVVIGLLAPGIPHFFYHLGLRFWGSLFLLSSPLTPPVLPGSPYPLVNGSLWTITYEFRCYLFVALFGVCGLLRRPIYWLLATAFLLVVWVAPLTHHLYWHKHFVVLGDPEQIIRMTATYFIGGCFSLFRSRIPFRAWLGVGAIVLLGISRFVPGLFEVGIVLFGGYLMFYATETRVTWVPAQIRFPDISYGIYLYGWPVEILWIWYIHGSPWVAFAFSVCVCAVLGWLSWHFVERPMLKLKRKPTVPLPA